MGECSLKCSFSSTKRLLHVPIVLSFLQFFLLSLNYESSRIKTNRHRSLAVASKPLVDSHARYVKRLCSGHPKLPPSFSCNSVMLFALTLIFSCVNFLQCQLVSKLDRFVEIVANRSHARVINHWASWPSRIRRLACLHFCSEKMSLILPRHHNDSLCLVTSSSLLSSKPYVLQLRLSRPVSNNTAWLLKRDWKRF